ncbi:hypothetical protein D3C86_2105580 [compost metagenome]
MRIPNQQFGGNPLTDRATLIDLDRELRVQADRIELGHMEAVSDQLAHPGSQVTGILGNQHDMHRVAV